MLLFVLLAQYVLLYCVYSSSSLYSHRMSDATSEVRMLKIIELKRK